MSKHDADFWEKAVDARNELAAHHAEDPNVKFVDLGYAPAGCENAGGVVLRVHVTDDQSAADSDGQGGIQQSASGIPVCVVRDAGAKK
jgi:hypothetical protein